MPVVSWEDPPPHLVLFRFLRRERKKLVEGFSVVAALILAWWALTNGEYKAIVEGMAGLLVAAIVDQGWEKRRWNVVILGFAVLVAALVIGIYGPAPWSDILIFPAMMCLILTVAVILKRILFPKQEQDAERVQDEEPGSSFRGIVPTLRAWLTEKPSREL
jgi:hypothetical protein